MRPEAITYADVAAAVSGATAREEFIDVSDEVAKQGMIQRGLPDSVAEQLVNIFAMSRQGAVEQVTATVESLTGRTLRDFASFARQNAHLFAPVAVGAR